MELILEKLIPVVGSKGWEDPKSKNSKYLNDITNFKNGNPSIILQIGRASCRERV